MRWRVVRGSDAAILSFEFTLDLVFEIWGTVQGWRDSLSGHCDPIALLGGQNVILVFGCIGKIDLHPSDSSAELDV